MISQKLIPVQGVSRMAGWTQWNPLLSTIFRPADISSDGKAWRINFFHVLYFDLHDKVPKKRAVIWYHVIHMVIISSLDEKGTEALKYYKFKLITISRSILDFVAFDF